LRYLGDFGRVERSSARRSSAEISDGTRVSSESMELAAHPDSGCRVDLAIRWAEIDGRLKTEYDRPLSRSIKSSPEGRVVPYDPVEAKMGGETIKEVLSEV